MSQVRELSEQFSPGLLGAPFLDFALISLDAELPDEIRRDALEDLEELLPDVDVAVQLENILYSRPLPPDGDLDGALKLCQTTRVPKVRGLFDRLLEYQPLIAEVSTAWDLIPSSKFAGNDKTTLYQLSVKEGLFRSLVLWNASIDRLASMDHLNYFRPVLQQWVRILNDAGNPALPPRTS